MQWLCLILPPLFDIAIAVASFDSKALKRGSAEPVILPNIAENISD
jgi:hypothetical protein